MRTIAEALADTSDATDLQPAAGLGLEGLGLRYLSKMYAEELPLGLRKVEKPLEYPTQEKPDLQ